MRRDRPSAEFHVSSVNSSFPRRRRPRSIGRPIAAVGGPLLHDAAARPWHDAVSVERFGEHHPELGCGDDLATAPTSNMLTFNVRNAVGTHFSVGSSLSSIFFAAAAASGVYRPVKGGGGGPAPAPPRPRPPPKPRPPTSPPVHHTPERLGRPSAIRGAGSAAGGFGPAATTLLREDDRRHPHRAIPLTRQSSTSTELRATHLRRAPPLGPNIP